MTKVELLDLVRNTAVPAAEQAGCELVDVEFVKEGAHWYLRVFIDKEGGVSLEDCEAVTRPVNEMLDEKDPIEQPFFLEVSSPGLERPLKTARDFAKCVGEPVEIRFYKPVGGTKQTEGTLRSFDGTTVAWLDAAGHEASAALADIAKINRRFVF